MRVLLDRPLPARMAQRLRGAGHDVVAAAERDELRSLDDATMLRAAAAGGRALVSANAPDMLALAQAGEPAHAGIVLLPHQGFPRSTLSSDRLARALSHLLDAMPAEDALTGRVHWLEPPRLCPFLVPSSLEASGA